jgi:hypothetical protein
MAEQRYNTNEPEPIQRESSALLAKVFALLREDGVTRAKIAKDNHLEISELDSLTRGLVLAALEGGRETGNVTHRSEATLRLVLT